MIRPVRIHVAGGMYHVCARGHNHEVLFGEAADWKKFLEILADMRE